MAELAKKTTKTALAVCSILIRFLREGVPSQALLPAAARSKITSTTPRPQRFVIDTPIHSEKETTLEAII